MELSSQTSSYIREVSNCYHSEAQGANNSSNEIHDTALTHSTIRATSATVPRVSFNCKTPGDIDEQRPLSRPLELEFELIASTSLPKTDADAPKTVEMHGGLDKPEQAVSEVDKLPATHVEGIIGEGTALDGQKAAETDVGEDAMEEQKAVEIGRFLPDANTKKRKRRIAFRILLLVAIVTLIAMLIFSAVTPPSLLKFDIGTQLFTYSHNPSYILVPIIRKS